MRCCIWSTTTAAMMTTPLMTICQNELTPSITSPSPSMPITKAPMIVPAIVPRPPDSEVPPSTAAAIALSSKVSPDAGCAATSSEATDEAGERRAEAGDHVDGHLHQVDLHAGQSRGPLVASDRVNVASERRARAT